MSDNNKYPGAMGFVQKFGEKPGVVEREANGQTIRDVTIKAFGTQKLIRITIWPEFAHVAITEGDAIAAEGKFDVSESNGKTYYNLNASKLAVLTGAVKGEREVVNRNAAAAGDAADEDAPF